MSLAFKALACALFIVTSAGCVVEAEPARPPPPPCAGGAIWYHGWRDRWGWHPGHWECRAREVIIVR